MIFLHTFSFFFMIKVTFISLMRVTRFLYNIRPKKLKDHLMEQSCSLFDTQEIGQVLGLSLNIYSIYLLDDDV